MKKKSSPPRAPSNAPRGRLQGLPREIGLSSSGEALVPAGTAQPMVIKTMDIVVKEALQLVGRGLLEGDDDLLLSGLTKVDALVHLHYAIDRGQPLLGRPQNARLLRDAGEAVIATAQGFPKECAATGVDTEALGHDVHRLGRLQRLQRRYEVALSPVESNGVVLEVQIDGDVRRAYSRLETAAHRDEELRQSLEPARLMVKGPTPRGAAVSRRAAPAPARKPRPRKR